MWCHLGGLSDVLGRNKGAALAYLVLAFSYLVFAFSHSLLHSIFLLCFSA